MVNKRVSAVLCVALVLAAGAAVYCIHNGDYREDGPHWSPSGIVGMLPDVAPDIRDDFYLGINYDLLSEIGPTYHTDFFRDLSDKATYNVVRLFSGDVWSYEQKLLQDAYAAYSDMDLRDSMGTDELMPMIADLMSAENLDDITSYLTSGNMILDGPLMVIGLLSEDQRDGVWKVIVHPPSLTLGDPRHYLGNDTDSLMEGVTSVFMDHLMLLGYTAEEADAMNRAATAVEAEIARGILSDTGNRDDFAVSLDDLSKMSFPIAEILSSQGYCCDEYLISCPGWLDTIDSIYVEDNFEGIRTFMLRTIVLTASKYMDGQFMQPLLDYWGVDFNTAVMDYVLQDHETLKGDLVNIAYMAKYAIDSDVADTVESIFHLLRDSACRYLDSCRWMNEELRAISLEKLEDMILVIGGSPSIDCSNLVMPSSVGEGGPLSDYIAMESLQWESLKAMAGQPVGRMEMNEVHSYSANAYYSSNSNAVILTTATMGCVDGDWSFEEIMAGIGFIIGHEIMHSVGPNNFQFDKDGNRIESLECADMEVYLSMTSSFSDYLSTLTSPSGKHVDGDFSLKEAIPDLYGMSLIMDVVSGIDGFDYDHFFRAHAAFWYEMMSEEYAEEAVVTDVHIYNCYRVNVTLQQFQEFYDTY